MCQYLRPWRMGQKFKLHTLKFCQCLAPTRRVVTQSVGSDSAGPEIQAGGAQEIICIMFLGYVPPV